MQTLKTAFRYTVPIMAAYIFLGFTFGLLLRTAGYPAWCPIMMSLVIYSGALEFAAVPLFAMPFDPIGSFLFGCTLSARHLFYGISMLKKYRNTGATKPFLIFAMTDETFSLLATQDDDIENKEVYYTYVTVLNFIYWNFGTVAGALFGGIIGINLEGLDFALTALFIVLFLEQIKTRKGKLSGGMGIALSLISLIAFGKENMVIASIIMILAGLLLGRRLLDNEQ